MPAVPFTNSHCEGVHVLVELVEHGDSLDDHIVRAINVELHFSSRIGMTQSQLGTADITHFETFEQLLSM